MIDTPDASLMMEFLPSTSSKYSGKFDWASLLSDWQFFVGDYLEVPLHPDFFLSNGYYNCGQAD